MNNVTSKTTIENGSTSEVKFRYDKLGRLIKEIYPNGKIEEFSYYQNGNIHYRTLTGTNGVATKEEYIYDSVIKDKLLLIKNVDTNEIKQQIVYSSTDVFKPTSMMIKNQSKSLTWQGRRLLKIGSDIQYEYNAEGIRTKKITPNETSTFELEGTNIIRMNKTTSNENVKLDFVYDASAMLVGLNTIEGNYFYVRDITGNIVGLFDKTGSFIVKYQYDAWGNILDKHVLIDSIASRHNPFVYKGYFLDEETNFYYLKSRYYDPTIRRFISIDSPQYIDEEDLSGLNLWAYCGNNPVEGFDPDGTWNWKKFWKGVGMIATGVTAVAVGILTLPYGGWIAAVAGVTILAGTGTTLLGLSDVGEGITDYNVIKEFVFSGNEEMYNLVENIFQYTAIVGTMVCGLYGATHTTISSSRSTPRQGKPHTSLYNKKSKVLTYYGKNVEMKYSIGFFENRHQWIHWHTELPHSEPINNVFKFLWEMAKRGF